jgi:hypothetical protein
MLRPTTCGGTHAREGGGRVARHHRFEARPASRPAAPPPSPRTFGGALSQCGECRDQGRLRQPGPGREHDSGGGGSGLRRAFGPSSPVSSADERIWRARIGSSAHTRVASSLHESARTHASRGPTWHAPGGNPRGARRARPASSPARTASARRRRGRRARDRLGPGSAPRATHSAGRSSLPTSAIASCLTCRCGSGSTSPISAPRLRGPAPVVRLRSGPTSRASSGSGQRFRAGRRPKLRDSLGPTRSPLP